MRIRFSSQLTRILHVTRCLHCHLLAQNVIYLQEGSFVTSDAASRLYLMFQKQLTPLRINGEEFCKATAEEELLLLQTSLWVALKAGGFAIVLSCLMQV